MSLTGHRGWQLVLQLQPGDVVVLKKAHPCGSVRWRVVRLGADIRLVCLGCGRRAMLSRRRLANRIKAVEPAAAGGEVPHEA